MSTDLDELLDTIESAGFDRDTALNMADAAGYDVSARSQEQYLGQEKYEEVATPEAPPATELRKLAPGMQRMAVTEGGLVPIEDVVFTEEEAALWGDVGPFVPSAPPPPPPPAAPPAKPPAKPPAIREMAPEEVRAQAPAQALKAKMVPGAEFKVPERVQEEREHEAEVDSAIRGFLDRSRQRMPAPGQAFSAAQAEAEERAALEEEEALERMRDPTLFGGEISAPAHEAVEDVWGEPGPEPEPEAPGPLDKIAQRAIQLVLQRPGRDKPVTDADIAQASAAAVLEIPVNYLADTAATVFGAALGAVEPIAAGVVGLGASVGIPGWDEPYQAAQNRMEKTIFDISKFYEGKLDDSIISNARSTLTELPSAIFQVAEGLLGGAITAEEMAAMGPIERAKVGYTLGRELGNQMTEGATAAFLMVFTDPAKAAKADPVGTILTVAPLLRGVGAGALSLERTALGAQGANLIKQGNLVLDEIKRSVSPTDFAGAKRLQAKADRVMRDAWASVERAERELGEVQQRAPETQYHATRSIGGEFAGEVARATERGEVALAREAPEAAPARGEPTVRSRAAEAGAEDAPVSDLFRPDESAASYVPNNREFEVFSAARDELTGVITLKRVTSEAALRKQIYDKYIKDGKKPETARKLAKKKAKEAHERGVAGYREVDIGASKRRLIKTLGPDALRMVEELGGEKLAKGAKKRPTKGLVDIDGEEFLMAMGEAIDVEAANILTSTTLRNGAVTALTRRYERAAGRKLTLIERESIERAVHDAASRMPPDAGSLGSTKTYDVVFDLPDGQQVSLLEVAKDIVVSDRKMAARVFQESMMGAVERLAQKAKQRRRKRGWLGAFGGREALKRANAPGSAAEARALADGWIADVQAGREPSLPPGFHNDPKRILAELERLVRQEHHYKAGLTPNFWARFKPGRSGWPVSGYRMMNEDMAMHVGLVQMTPRMQAARRAVNIAAPFNSFDDMAPIWLPKHVHHTLELMMKEEAWRLSRSHLAQMERSMKANNVARNARAIVNASTANVMYQSVRRGDPMVLGKMIKAVKLYRRWRDGQLTDPAQIRMLEAIDRTGVLESTYVKSELNKAYGGGKGGLLTEVLDKTRATRLINKLTDMQEAAFSWTDAGAKLEDAIHNWKLMGKYMDDVAPGEWIQGRIGPSKSARIYKDAAGRWRLNTPDGRVLSDAQLAQVQARISIQPGLNAFFDYGDVGKAARTLRAGNAVGAIVSTAGNSYWTWQNKAMTIPGVQRGLALNAMLPGPQILSSSKKVMVAQSMDMAAAGFRRAALVQGARNTLGDREYHEALRDALQYEGSRHKGATVTFNRLANPTYISAKNWSSSNFLEPFDNLLGVIDATLSAPPELGAATIASLREEARENPAIRSMDEKWADYDDMTILWSSLDPNNEHDLSMIFPPLPPEKRSGPWSASIDKARGYADSDESMRYVPPEYRREVRQQRNFWRDAWSGKKDRFSSAVELSGMTGGLFQRSWQFAEKVITQKGVEVRDVDRFWSSLGPMMMGGTTWNMAQRGVLPALYNDRNLGGSVWRYLPADADYGIHDTLSRLWPAILNLGGVHMRAIGKGDRSVGEMNGVLDKDISDLKKNMRSSIRGELGDAIVDMNALLAEYDGKVKAEKTPNMDEEDHKTLTRQRDIALEHWHLLMGDKAPWEGGKSKGGLINTMAEEHKQYIIDGWSTAPVLAPGERKPGMPAPGVFSLW